MSRTLVFATGNKHKLNEVQSFLGEGFALLSLREVGIVEDIPETASTLEGNALIKARYVFEKCGKSCFADDTGLEIDALGGEPGVYSARYAGVDKDSEANMRKVLEKLEGVSNRSCRFRTVIAYIGEKGDEHLFEGIVNGRIIVERRGCEGFGYDPIFVPDGWDLTFAEIPIEKKNTISHRGRAMAALLEYLNNK